MDERKAELVNHICTTCGKNGFTYRDLEEIIEKVEEFYYNNAKP